MAFTPAGFDAAAIRAGLLTAMDFGAPTRTDDKATFYMVTQSVPTGTAVDAEGVPFDPNVKLTTTRTPIQVPCAVDYSDAGGTMGEFGTVASTHVTITLLDEEYQQIKGFAYVVCGGDKYFHSKTPPPEALGSIDVWTVICYSVDER